MFEYQTAGAKQKKMTQNKEKKAEEKHPQTRFIIKEIFNCGDYYFFF